MPLNQQGVLRLELFISNSWRFLGKKGAEDVQGIISPEKLPELLILAESLCIQRALDLLALSGTKKQKLLLLIVFATTKPRSQGLTTPVSSKPMLFVA